MSSKKLPKELGKINFDLLTALNSDVEATKDDALAKIGGLAGLMAEFQVDMDTGLSEEQVSNNRDMFGKNVFPESLQRTYCELLLDA